MNRWAAVAAILTAGPGQAAVVASKQPQAPSQAVVEIRVYTLKPGTRGEFHRRFVEESLPLLRRRRVDVVAYGPSIHDDESYYLIRAFPSPSERERQEDAFYSSAEWIEGPRAAVLAAIETYSTALVPVGRTTLEGLRHMTETTTKGDHATLVQLNAEYLCAAETSDATQFEAILAPDFRCTLPDGTFLDRAQFLDSTSRSAGVRDLQAHDLEVRVLGDSAIVHARTEFTHPDGRRGQGRYTDVWVRRNGRWLAVAAHVTRH